MTKKKKTPPSADLEELEKFEKMADEWWDLNGKFKPLHDMNKARLGYITEAVKKNFRLKSQRKIFENLNAVDIGCGGGILSEPIARLGANLTSIDLVDKNIEIAKLHAKKMNLDINYLVSSVEDLAENKKKYDVIFALEILEHLNDIDSFIKSCSKILKKDGLIFFSTINRTYKSYFFAILGAEYVLRWLPIGTHSWDKFLKPSEIVEYTDKYDIILKDIKGFSFDLYTRSWNLSDDKSVNYIMSCQKA